MKRLIILTDEESRFLISIADSKNYTSMDINKVKSYFQARDFSLKVCKFSELNLAEDYNGAYIIYQTSEAPGSFYKRFIEDVIYFLEKQGAIVMPKYELLRAHHDKVFMEMMRSKFIDKDLRTIKSKCYGSWLDAWNYDSAFPVVVKQASNAGGAGVFLARNKKEYQKIVKKAGKIIIASDLSDLYFNSIKNSIKNLIKYFNPLKSRYVRYNTTPVSTSLVVQTFIEGLHGDYKVLIFGNKYYSLYRKNRNNDFRASGSGRFFEVPLKEHEGLLSFAKKIVKEIDFPIFGLDIGFDGKEYHLFEFQMLHLGPFALQNSKSWYQFQDTKWVKYDGKSDLEIEFSRAIIEYINLKYKNN